MIVDSPSLERPRGPKCIPWLGVLPGLLRDPLRTYARIAAHGDVAEYYVLGQRTFLVSHPDYIATLFQQDNASLTKSIYHTRVKPIFGNGLVTSEDDLWRTQRRLMQPAFNKSSIAGFAAAIADATARHLREWLAHAERGSAFDVRDAVIAITQTILVRTIFGTNISTHQLATARQAVGVLNAQMYQMLLFPWLRRLPLPRNRRFETAMRNLERLMHEVIATKVQEDAPGDDLLSILLAATHAGERMSAEQLRDEMITLFFAGHDTTATTLTWALYLAQGQPDYMRRLQAEVDAVLDGAALSADAAERLPTVRHLIDETLRLYPPAYVITRNVIKPVQLGPYTVPSGTVVAISPYRVQRDPRFWDHPDAFDPDRFNDDRARGRHKYAFFPFAGGPRTCIGIHFALLEAVVVLALIIREFEFELVPGQAIRPQALATLRTNRRVLMRLKARRR